MKTQYDYNLSRIYEMVINTDPCYAFLLEGNSLVQNKMVIAHVLAHCDFFKHNVHFGSTSRDMVESMASSAERIRGYESKYGKQRVEKFIDSVIALQEHVDYHHHIKKNAGALIKQGASSGDCKSGCGGGCSSGCGTGCGSGGASGTGQQGGCGGGCQCKDKDGGGPSSPYDDLWDLDKKEEVICDEDKPKPFPERPEKDILLFIMEHARDLSDWQRDIISVVRQEMLYFWPQMETKIMNEGWASYWHLRIMREMDLTEDEAVEFAKMHAGVIQTSKTRINPYYLGLKIFEDIEKRWDSPTAEEKERYGRQDGQGKKKIFEVRETENDISFLRNYLTQELVEEMDLYLFKKIGYDWKVVDKEWEIVRDSIVANLTNAGFPYLVVWDGDFNKRGELFIKHQYEGIEMDVFYLERTLPHVYNLWGRPAHLETIIDNKKVLFTHNGDKTSKRFI